MKTCPSCNLLKNKFEFVDTYGKPTPRGKRCKVCFEERNQREREESFSKGLKSEKSIMKKLEIVYGENWYCYSGSHLFSLTLFMERDFCLYCGKSFKENQKSKDLSDFSKKYHIDHMNPIIFGGEGGIRNSVCVCKKCNLKKGSKLFADWIKRLKPKYKKLSRKVYFEKQGFQPEEFKPGNQIYERDYGCPYWTCFDEDVIREMKKNGELPSESDDIGKPAETKFDFNEFDEDIKIKIYILGILTENSYTFDEKKEKINAICNQNAIYKKASEKLNKEEGIPDKYLILLLKKQFEIDKELSEILFSRIGSLENIRKTSDKELLKINGIDEKILEKLRNNIDKKVKFKR